MRGSDDLLKVVAVLHGEMNNLGIVTPQTAIVLIDEDRGQIVHYCGRDNPKKFGASWSSASWLEHDKNTIIGVLYQGPSDGSDINKSMYEHWQNSREVHLHEFTPNKLQVENSVRRQLGIDGGKAYLDDFWGKFEGKVETDIPFDYGLIGYLQKGRNEKQESIVRELAEALTLGYLRYLDFQKVDEAQKSLIDELEEELQTAHTLQMGLMPTEPPQIEGFDITGRCIPANHVGGDFFQYFEQDGKLSICMADVTGHAMEAAIPVVMFSGVLHSQMEEGHAIESLFARLNNTMSATLDSRTYVCFTMGELDVADRSFRIANSGCPYPFHFRAATGDVVELQGRLPAGCPR